MKRYIVSTWDGYSIICPNWRKAKAVYREGNRESYCAWIKPYNGSLKTWTEGAE